MHASVSQILSEYGISQAQVHALNNAGGFSGAQLWRVTANECSYCLRLWPSEQPDAERLRFIHAVIAHAARRIAILPVPLMTTRGTSFVDHAGRLWELVPWLSGAAQRGGWISTSRLRSALAKLAEFHLSTANFPTSDADPRPSPALERRREQLLELQVRGVAEFYAALPACAWQELRPRAERLLALFTALAPGVEQQLRLSLHTAVQLQPCLRDIWSEHVLFTGEEVSGLIDFGALRWESIAGDIARLLGSFVADDREGWQAGRAAYEAVRPITPAESSLVDVFDSSQVLLSGMNWLNWILLERRTFLDPPAVLQRLDAILDRLEHRQRSRPLILDTEP